MAKSSQTKYYFSVVGVIVLIILAVVAVLNAGQLQNVLSPTAVKSKPRAGELQPSTTYTVRDTFDDGVIGPEWAMMTRGEGVIVKELKKGQPTERLNIIIPAGLDSITGLGKMGGLRFVGTATASASPVADFVLKAELRKVDVPKGALGRAGIRFTAGSEESDERAVIRRRSQPGRDELQFVVRKPDGTLAESEVVTLRADKITIRLERVGSKYRAWYKPGVDNSGVPWTKIGAEQDDAFGGSGYLELFAANFKSDGGKRVVTRFDDAVVKW